jgi:hypothetical protein
MMMAVTSGLHKDAVGTEVHEAFQYVAAGDPGAVGAGMYWLDTSSSPYLLKRRNATNDGWISIGAAGEGSGAMPLVVFRPMANEPPLTNYATLDLRNYHPVLDFDADTDESAVWTGILPYEYAGNGLTVYIHWMATSDTNAAHKCRWDVSIERCAENDLDLDSDSFAAVQSVTGNPNATSGKVTVSSIVFTSGAQMDSLVAGELFRLKLTRDANHVSDDDMTGDAEVLEVVVRETV